MLAYLTNPFIQIMDTNGTPVAGAKIYVYNADTTNLATTYSDFDGTQNTNPVIVDELGNVTIIADDSLVYDIEVKNPDDDLLFGKKYISPGEGGMSVSGCVVSAGPGIIVNQSVQNNKTVFTVLTDNATIPTFSDLSAYQQKLSAGNNIVFSGNTVNLADTVIIDGSAYEHRITRSTDRLENTTTHSVNLQNAVQNIITNNNGYSNDMRADFSVLSHGTETNTTEATANTISSYAAGKNTYSQQTHNAVVVNSASTLSPYLGTSARITPEDVKVVNRVASGEVIYSLTGLQTAVDAILPYSAGANINITDYVISGKDWTSAINNVAAANSWDVTPYSAGANIDITNHVISGKNWSNEITAENTKDPLVRGKNNTAANTRNPSVSPVKTEIYGYGNNINGYNCGTFGTNNVIDGTNDYAVGQNNSISDSTNGAPCSVCIGETNTITNAYMGGLFLIGNGLSSDNGSYNRMKLGFGNTYLEINADGTIYKVVSGTKTLL